MTRKIGSGVYSDSTEFVSANRHQFGEASGYIIRQPHSKENSRF